jgi:hypothetical protein
MALGEVGAVDFPERLDPGVAVLLSDMPILVAMAMIQSFRHVSSLRIDQEKRHPPDVIPPFSQTDRFWRFSQAG